MLQQLGADAMSSDETDSNQESSRLIHRVPWRSFAVTAWLRLLDDIHTTDRLTAVGQPGNGKPVPSRQTSDKLSTREGVVVALPENAYEAGWWHSLSEAERSRVAAARHFNYSHTEEAMRYAYVPNSCVALKFGFSYGSLAARPVTSRAPKYRVRRREVGREVGSEDEMVASEWEDEADDEDEELEETSSYSNSHGSDSE